MRPFLERVKGGFPGPLGTLRIWRRTGQAACLERFLRLMAGLPLGRTGQHPALIRVFGILFLAEAVLVALNAFSSHWTWTLSMERNVPTYYHSAILVAVALSLWCVGGLGTVWRRRAALPVHRAPLWLATGALFLYLAIDEAAEIHERASPKLWQTLGLWDRLEYIWEAAFAPLFGLIALLMLALMFRHRRHLAAFLWLGLAALALWGMALALKLMQLTFLPSMRPWYSLAVNVEETLEMVASTLFLLGCALFLRRILGWDRPPPTKVAEGAVPMTPIMQPGT